MNNRQSSEIITFLAKCKDVAGPRFDWVKIIDEMLEDLTKQVVSGQPIYIPGIIRDAMPVDLTEEMLGAPYVTRYTTHLGYTVSTRDSIIGAAIIMVAAAATAQAIYIDDSRSDSTQYADIMVYRHRANVRPERIDEARDLWRAFLSKYLGDLEPLAEELDPDY